MKPFQVTHLGNLVLAVYNSTCTFAVPDELASHSRGPMLVFAELHIACELYLIH
jgi:hypothetical protein